MNDIHWHKSGQNLITEIAEERVPENTCCIWPLGQCGFVLKTADAVIGTDLVLSHLYNAAGISPRLYEPPFAPDAGLKLSLLLVSHNHSDHLDVPTIEGLLKTNPDLKVVIPAAVKNEVTLSDDRIIYLKQDTPAAIPGGSVTGIATAHDVYRYDEAGASFSLGYVIRQKGITFFHSGDALSDQLLLQNVVHAHPDVVFLPINGRDAVRTNAGIVGNMTMEEAVLLAQQISPEVFIPMHHDMFANNGFDIEICRQYAEKSIPDIQTIVPLLGEKIVLKF
ncbi:MAG: MBL fold metallo-hydrolase [Treponema sp.]|nr:MBL fold metallo-hydrolase [Treponema sp.]